MVGVHCYASHLRNISTQLTDVNQQFFNLAVHICTFKNSRKKVCIQQNGDNGPVKLQVFIYDELSNKVKGWILFVLAV